MDLRAVTMGVIFAFIWASAFTSARMIVLDAPPLMALTLRFLASGALAIAIALAAKQRIRLSRSQWRGVIIFGVMQNAVYLGLNFVAMQRIEASVAAIIASTMPLLVALIGWVVLRERLRPLAVFGLIAGFGGVVVIMVGRIDGGLALDGVVLSLVAALGLAIATLTVRSASGGGNLMMVVGLQMLVGALALAPFALVFETWQVNWSPRLVAAFLYTTLAPGILATWIWFALVERIGAVRAAAFHFLNPFFGVLVAAWLLGEYLGAWDLVGVSVVAGGILAVQIARARVPANPGTQPPQQR